MTFIYGILINSTLYLVGCFVVGLVRDNPFAWRLALASAALSYVGYVAQTRQGWYGAAERWTIAGMVAGAAAGLTLLF